MEIRVSGGRDLADLRDALRRVNDKALARKLSRGLSKATEALPKEIGDEIPRVMPSGYAPVLSKSMRYRRSVRERSGSAQVTLRIYGDGRKKKRDVPSLNRGRLKHPHWGNRRIWHTQTIRKGFVDRPTDRLRPKVQQQMHAVIDDIARQITKG